MNREKIEEYDAFLPRLSKRAMEALSSDFRRAVFVLVASEGPKSFSEIMHMFEANQGSLYRALHILQIGGLLSNYYERSPDSRVFSYYDATDFGREVIQDLVQVRIPSLKPVPVTSRINIADWLQDMQIDIWRGRFKEPGTTRDRTQPLPGPRQRTRPPGSHEAMITLYTSVPGAAGGAL